MHVEVHPSPSATSADGLLFRVGEESAEARAGAADRAWLLGASAVPPFKASILNRFCDVRGANVRGGHEVGDRARHTGDAVERAPRIGALRSRSRAGASRPHRARNTLRIKLGGISAFAPIGVPAKRWRPTARAVTTRSRMLVERSAPIDRNQALKKVESTIAKRRYFRRQPAEDRKCSPYFGATLIVMVVRVPRLSWYVYVHEPG